MSKSYVNVNGNVNKNKPSMQATIIERFNLPSNLPSGYTYYCNLADEAKDEISIRVKEINNEQSAQKWLTDLQQASFVTWKIARTYPNSGKVNLYKISLRCQHLTDKRAKTSIKNTDCPAKLDITVKRFVKKSRSKKVDSLTEDYPCVLNFKWTHNHAVNSALALKNRDASEETKQKLSDLFRRGHSAASALYFLKTDILLEHGDDYCNYIDDSFYVPSKSVVHKLFHKKFSEEYTDKEEYNGRMSGPEMFASLENVLEEYNKSTKEGFARFQRSGDHYFVVICTPIMKRAHIKLAQSRGLVLVDAYKGSRRCQNQRIYCLSTPTSAGGVPLGIIITDTEAVLTEAISCFKSILVNFEFFGQGYPNIFLTEDDLAAKQSLQDAFPESNLLLCQFHVCKTTWAWLLSHKIDKSDRQQLYLLFKLLLCAPTEAEAEDKYAILHSSALKYPAFVRYVEEMWKNRTDWASYCRHQLQESLNDVEIVFRILNACIFNRLKAFNLLQIVDFVLTRYELYVEKQLIDFVNGRFSNKSVCKFLIKDADIPSDDIVPCEHNYFQVRSQTDRHVYYDVDMAGFCSCPEVQNGKLCKHASAVITHVGSTAITSAYNAATTSTKDLIHFVAKGRLQLKLDEEHPLQLSAEEEKQVNTEEETDELENIKEEVMEPEAQLNPNEAAEFHEIWQTMQNGMRNDPAAFVPAARKMIANYNAHAQTDDGLISAMCNFAKCPGFPQTSSVTDERMRHDTRKICMQPTPVSRRKTLPGKNKSKSCVSVKRKRSDTGEHNYCSSVSEHRRIAPKPVNKNQ